MQFKLGTFSAAGGRGVGHSGSGGGVPFPALVLSGGDPATTSGAPDRVIPLARLESVLTRLNLQLRQPILLADGRTVVSVSPQEGFLHQFSELDTLGFDRPETKCRLK